MTNINAMQMNIYVTYTYKYTDTMQTNTQRERERERDDMQRNIILPNLKTRLCIQIYLYHENRGDSMTNLFI